MARSGPRSDPARMSRTQVSRRGFLRPPAWPASAARSPPAAASGARPRRRAARRRASAAASRRRPAASAAPPRPLDGDRGALFMYNWADYIDPRQHRRVQEALQASTKFTYDTYASNEELLAKLQGGAAGQYDIGGPDRRVRRGHGRGQASSRSSTGRRSRTLQVHQPAVQGPVVATRTTSTTCPRTGARPGITVADQGRHGRRQTGRTSSTSRRSTPGGSSSSTRRATSSSPRSRRSATRSTRSIPASSSEARKLLMGFAPHVLALDSDTYEDTLPTEEAVLGLTWTGGIDELQRRRRRRRTRSTSSPRTGRCTGWTPGSSSRTPRTRTPPTPS